MSLTAFATTSANQVGADAGISVEEAVMENGQLMEHAEIDRLNVELSLDSEDGGLDEDGADRILEGMGFARTEQWALSGGQYAARVEAIGA